MHNPILDLDLERAWLRSMERSRQVARQRRVKPDHYDLSICLSVLHPGGEAFVDWLFAQGHDACVIPTRWSFVDCEHNQETDELVDELWYTYQKEIRA
jgi:hypothetical protein